MIGRRAIVGLSLLSPLVFFAFATSSALAVEDGVTAFTCAPSVKGAKEGFKDAHCVEPTGVEAEVKFEHVEIEPGKATKITTTNKETTNKTKQSTPAVINFTLGGVAVEIICAETTGTGELTNNPGPPMTVSGTAKVEYKECMVPNPRTAEGATRCKVKEPIVAKTVLKSIHLGVEGEFGVEITPETGKPFAEITLEEIGANKCTIKGTYKVEGKAIARVRGATGTFESGPGELTVGGAEALLSKTITVKMEGGNPITGTTTET